MSSLYITSPLGYLTLQEQDNQMTGLHFGRLPLPPDTMQTTPLLERAAHELSEYFAGQRQVFDLPLNPQGTPFMKKVWRALCEIPYGATVSYRDIAVEIGCPLGCRAVGLANNHNPIAIIIPCHRVIGKNGKLVGYGGGLPIKEKLLELEQAFPKGD